MEKLEPQTQQALTEAVSALRQGNPDETIRICESYLLTSPSSIPHLQLWAHALIIKNQLGLAQEKINFAIKITPDFAPLYEDLGSIQALNDDFDNAIASLRRAIQIDPRLAGAHKKLAQALMAAGRNDEIDEAFENYLDHDDDAALVVIGAEHWRADRLSEAESTLTKALRKNPNNVDAMRFLAMVYHGQNKKLNDAEALLRKATDIAPDFHQAYNNLGRILIDNGKWHDAIDCYQKLVKLQPQDDTAWAGLGRSYSYAGQVEVAVTAYENSLSIKQDSPSVHLAYAHMLKTLGRQVDALAAYRNVGRSTLAAPNNCPGVVLSHPPSNTTPSNGLPRNDSSTSIDNKLRYNIAVGRICVSPKDITGNSSGTPPASHTPFLTLSAISRR